MGVENKISPPEQLILINTEKYFEPLNPEIVWGHEFRIPTIRGEGTGHGFSLDETYLPEDWEKKIDNLKDLNPKNISKYFSDLAMSMGIKSPLITRLDEQNILREMLFMDGSYTPPTLRLSERFDKQEKGQYEFKNVNNIKHALAFQAAMSKWFWAFDKDNKYPYIISNCGYGPADLAIPKEIKNKKSGFVREDIQNKFLNKAHAIAGSFGLDGCSLKFNENGHIVFAEVYPGENGCYFSTTGSLHGEFGCHNVDTPEQAAALLSIITTQFNELLPNKY